MESTVAIISSIVALVSTAGAFIYKVFLKKGDDREQEYYLRLLKPFIRAIRHNPDVDAIKFVKANVQLEDDFVPKYITYLVDQGAEKKEDLRKVFVRDYFSIYCNNENRLENAIMKISQLLVWILWGIGFCFLTVASFFIVLGLFATLVFCILSPLVKKVFILEDVCLGLGVILIGVIILGFAWLLMKFSRVLDEDRYTFEKSKIENKIKKKIDYYDNHKDDWIL